MLESQTQSTWLDRLLRAPAGTVLGAALVLMVLAVVADWATGDVVSLGILYSLPIMLAGLVLNRKQIALAATGAAIVRLVFLSALNPLDAVLRFLLGLAAYLFSGLFVAELVRNRRLIAAHLDELHRQQELRRAAEDQLRMLAESSPAAIFTVDQQGRVLAGNRSTCELFGLDQPGDLAGRPVSQYLPVLAEALRVPVEHGFFRAAVESKGRRANGEVFVALTWFSTYRSPEGIRLAAIAVDSSEEMRDREEQNLRQLVDSNRIIAAAISHEVRNVCGALSMVYSNLKREAALADNEDFRALGSLVTALEGIAALDLSPRSTQRMGAADLREVLDQLRIVIEPNWDEISGHIEWSLPERIPRVRGEAFGLMQAFLNLCQNSLRAVQDGSRRELAVAVGANGAAVRVAFTDSGPGVRMPERLFQPFQPGSENAGLGLYISRAILRNYGGDLRYEPEAGTCRFVVELAVAVEAPQG